MRRRQTAPAVRITAVLAAVAALGACGNGESGDDASPEPTATATVTVTATVTATPTATATATETVTPEPTTRGCGQVGFEPSTDAGAFDIKATGVDCRPTGTVGQLPSVVYECSGPDGATVTFNAS